jgi:flagellar assembly factor FliW
MMSVLTRGDDVSVSTDLDLPVLEFADGIPGFPGATRFVLVRLDESGLVLDLQSLDDPAARFVVVPSVAFFPDYAPEIDDVTAVRLGLGAPDTAPADALVLLMVTVGDSLAESTANLMAPIVVNTAAQTAAQVVLDDPSLPLRAPLAA